MWTYEHTLETEATPEAIWSRWADVSTWSRWDDDIVWAQLDGPFEVGSKGKLKPKGVPAAGFTLTSVDHGVSYTVEQRLPLATLRFHHELAPSDGSPTRFTHRATIEGPLSSVYGAVFGRRMKANFGSIMRHLAEDALGNTAGADRPSE